MTAPRKTQRIPYSQRKRKEIKLTLDPDAHEVLETVPHGKKSEYVSELIIDDGQERGVLPALGTAVERRPKEGK